MRTSRWLKIPLLFLILKMDQILNIGLETEWYWLFPKSFFFHQFNEISLGLISHQNLFYFIDFKSIAVLFTTKTCCSIFHGVPWGHFSIIRNIVYWMKNSVSELLDYYGIFFFQDFSLISINLKKNIILKRKRKITAGYEY